MIKVELTEKEEYFIERNLDRIRDESLRGISQYVELAIKDNVPKEYKEFINNKTKEFIEVFDFMHTLCAKLELARLESLK